MLLKFFKGTGPGVIFMIAVVSALVMMSVFFRHPLASETIHSGSSMPLYSIIEAFIIPGRLPAMLLSLSITVAMLFLLVNFNTTIFFISERTFLPALIFVFLTAIFPEYQVLNPVIPASLFFMIALKRIMAGYHRQGFAYNFFDAGILISTGSLFYANLIWFGLIILIGIILLRTVSIAEIAIMLLGIITPYLITFGIYYVLEYEPEALLKIISDNLFIPAESYSFSRIKIVTLIYLAILAIISTGYLLMLQNSKKIRSRKTFSILIWIFVFSLTAYFAVPSVSVEIMWITAIPVSYILTHYFIYYKKKIISEIFFLLVLILVLIIQGFYLYGG